MGQAKQRGSYEERKAQAIARQEAEAHRQYEAMKISSSDLASKKKSRPKPLSPYLSLVAMASILGGGMPGSDNFFKPMQSWRKK